MTEFHDVSFPLPLSFGASGGPERRTDIVSLASGREYRSTPHSQSRRRYDVGAGIRSLPDLQTMMVFFEARQGRRYAFRFRDPIDHTASGEIIGSGDDMETDFQLIKSYSDSGGAVNRTITKPKVGSVSVFVDGILAAVAIDHLTGIVTFASAPASGVIITADFEFDVPVRFDIDHLNVSLEAVNAGQVANLPLTEVLDHA